MSEAASNPDEAWRCKCGEPIIGEDQSGDPTQRKPCPKCGSASRIIALSARATVSISGRTQLTVVTYPQRLLTIARRLIDEDEFGIAVVVAHMACEIASERSLSEAFGAKGLQYFEDWVNGLNLGYNLANERIRSLYTALTGDEIQKEAFWEQFKESARRRNRIMHRGLIVAKAEAEDLHKAATDIVTHLKK